MTDKQQVPVRGEFVAPSSVHQLLHDAESEYYALRGDSHGDDTRGDVDRRLRAQQEFMTKPDSPFMNYMDCADFMQERTGLPLLLCVYYMFYMSESAGAIDWPSEFSPEAADECLRQNLGIGFDSAVANAVIGALVHPQAQWREFNRGIIEAVIEQEDGRRLQEARRLYDVMNERSAT